MTQKKTPELNDLQPQKISKAPDDQLKLIESQDAEEEPRVFKISQRGSKPPVNRRDFLKGLTGVLAGAAIGKVLTGCDPDITVEKVGDQCACHVVCTCDTDEDGEKHLYDANWTRQSRGGSCTCDAVCICNTVCTCHSVQEEEEPGCTCDSQGGGGGGGGGGGHYWYPN